MIFFLIFMTLTGFITWYQALIIGIFECLCILYRKWEKENGDKTL